MKVSDTSIANIGNKRWKINFMKSCTLCMIDEKEKLIIVSHFYRIVYNEGKHQGGSNCD